MIALSWPRGTRIRPPRPEANRSGCRLGTTWSIGRSEFGIVMRIGCESLPWLRSAGLHSKAVRCAERSYLASRIVRQCRYCSAFDGAGSSYPCNQKRNQSRLRSYTASLCLG